MPTSNKLSDFELNFASPVATKYNAKTRRAGSQNKQIEAMAYFDKKII